jgi:hypothetical protein
MPPRYEDAVNILIASLTPLSQPSDAHGLAVFFYLPHVGLVALYGLDAATNGNRDPFEISMRPFLIRFPERTLARLMEWTRDAGYHVRRSVANHVGDIAKDHPEIVFKLCKSWLIGASSEQKG